MSFTNVYNSEPKLEITLDCLFRGILHLRFPFLFVRIEKYVDVRPRFDWPSCDVKARTYRSSCLLQFFTIFNQNWNCASLTNS